MTASQIERNLKLVKSAAAVLRQTSSELKNQVLQNLAQALKEKKDQILIANEKDLKALAPAVPNSFRDRLMLNDQRLFQMQESLKQVARLSDPNGEVVEKKVLRNGLNLRRVRSPLGVIFMIFESRPNVAIEAFSLAFKASNATVLRGGKESKNTVKILFRLIEEALVEAGMPRQCVWGIDDPDRKIPTALLKQKHFIDVVVPRGGDGLINFVVKNSEIPIIKNDRGLCHVYVHQDADQEMALNIIDNAKTQRPGVCNAMETLLVHEEIAREILPLAYQRLMSKAVEWRVCPRSWNILKGKASKDSPLKKASKKDWDTEHLDLIMNCKIVAGLEEALAHISDHGSRHSEAIVTASPQTGAKFQAEVDAAAVYLNASTRFTDGFEFGLGGELGISTQKLHVRGPVGLRELTSLRWIIEGQGQVRS